jgi:hypothetical protein
LLLGIYNDRRFKEDFKELGRLREELKAERDDLLSDIKTARKYYVDRYNIREYHLK